VATKLTKRAIQRLAAPDPSGKQRLVWDAELKGFGVLVSGKTTAKTYIAQRKLPGGLTRRVSVGSVVEIDLDRARAMAADLLNDMRHGRDPKRRSAAPWTLRWALDDYLSANSQIKPRTAAGYRATVEGPVGAITREAIEQRHRRIQTEVEERRRANARRAGRALAQPEHWGSAAGASTANGVMRALRAVYNHAADRAPDLPPNPTRAPGRASTPSGR
jgi:hypothetical protein